MDLAVAGGWMHDHALAEAPVDAMLETEVRFWNQLTDKYLRPVVVDAQKKVRYGHVHHEKKKKRKKKKKSD